MNIILFQRVVVNRDLPEEDLCRGDVATVVEIHRDGNGNAIGYEVELFAADGRTLAVASVPVDAVRQPTPTDRLASRVAELHV
ncbi:MAG: DUF4926 domain-containing protein [Pirellulales bacterium]|nr:DUF4926 domain-containing protein [Pirellulales bacterium]